MLGAPLAEAEPTYRHGVSVFGEFKYSPDFEHFDYVNPNAPKGGTLVLATGANWNSFTPLLHKGINPPGTSVINAAGLYDGLLTQAEDEFGTFYGNLAESVMIADDASWVRFRLRPEARWHDGEPVTARDVAFTYEHVREAATICFCSSTEAENPHTDPRPKRPADIACVNSPASSSLRSSSIIPTPRTRLESGNPHGAPPDPRCPPRASGHRVSLFAATRSRSVVGDPGKR